MKVTDLRRKLLASLAAGGLLAPCAGYAADLNTDLVANGGFEIVDTNTTSAYFSPKILNWLGTNPGFAYSHNGSLSGPALDHIVPDYAEGADPPSAGNWYFSPNLGSDKNAPGQFYQDIDVSTGAAATVIGAGTGGFSMSAYMSSYDADSDFGNVHLDFRNIGGSSLGTSLMSDLDPGPANIWSPVSKTGGIPIGTATIRLSVYGTSVGGGGPDGYTDNVTFQVTNVLPELSISINRGDGSMTLNNLTSGAKNISGYSITSAFEALDQSKWKSITDNYDLGNAGPNQIDAAHAWSKLSDPTAKSDLSEADLQAGTGASYPQGKSVLLGNPGTPGNAGTWIQNPNEDLVFQYVSGGQVKTGIVVFTGNSNSPFLEGDLNTDGNITSADWIIFRNNQHVDLSSFSLAEAYRHGDLNGDKKNDFKDFVEFKIAFDAAPGSGGFSAMLGSLQNTPEPSSCFLMLAGGLFALPLRRRFTSQR